MNLHIITIAVKGVIAVGYLATVVCLIIAILMIQEGREYTSGAIQVVQIYTEAAGLIAIPLLLTKCIEGIYRYSVSAYNDWLELEEA